MYFVIPLRTPGLVLGDLLPRLYLNEAATPLPAGASLSDLGGGNYLVNGLPAGDRLHCYTLTYEYGGVWYSKVWGGWADHGGAPVRVVVPVRTAGQNAVSLGLTLYRAGEEQAVSFAVTELGAPGAPGDYRVSGWELRTEGAVNLLTWEPGGELSWRESLPVATGTRLDLPERALTAFTTAWRAATPPAPLTAMPHVVGKGGGWSPSSQEPYVELDILMDKGEEWGPVGMKNYDMVGLLQASIHVKDGIGTPLIKALAALAAACIEGMSVSGLRVYGCRMPYELPSPPVGYYSRAVDAPARYLGP